MAYDEVQRAEEKPYGLKMDGRERLELHGVQDVAGFDETTVMLSTVGGELTVRGTGLHIERIDLDAGELELRGNIQELGYEETPVGSSLWSRLFGT